MNWTEKAEELKFDKGLSWTSVAKEVQKYFPELTERQVYEKVRTKLRQSERYQAVKQEDFERSSLEYKKDGSIVSEKFITVRKNTV